MSIPSTTAPPGRSIFATRKATGVEIFVDTPWYVAQPRVDPLDLSMTDEEISAATLKLIENEPTFKPAEDWKQEFKSRLSAG